MASERAARTILPVASAVVVTTGLPGTFLHARGIAQRPGGWAMAAYDLEMGPPLLAPAPASPVGGTGLLAPLLRREGTREEAASTLPGRARARPAGRAA